MTKPLLHRSADPWPPERIERLAELFGQGLSSSQIARQLGDGATRNAVIGKLARLGMKRGVPTHRQSLPRVFASRPAKPPQTTSLPFEIDPLPLVCGRLVSTMDLHDGMCHWPHGEPSSEAFHYCGHPVRAQGEVYCEVHARQAYQSPWAPKRSEAA